MNVSLEKEMWEEENFEKHLEGIGKMGKEDKIHQFTYYQWGAFFFLMQVGNLALKNKLSSCKWTQTKLKANLAKTLQSKLSGQAAYFAAPRLLSKTSYYKNWLISQIIPILDQDKFYKNTSIQTIWPGGLFCGTATPLARPWGRGNGRSGQGGRESKSYEEGPIVLDDWQDINNST